MEFERLYQRQDESEALRPLLHALYVELRRDHVHLLEIREALIRLLEFLASPLGRTDANCRAVDSFFAHDAAWDAKRLPGAYADILADMGGALHDTVSAPSIAANFESTPEQLLGRARAL